MYSDKFRYMINFRYLYNSHPYHSFAHTNNLINGAIMRANIEEYKAVEAAALKL